LFPYARQVNCLTYPERYLVEAFRVLVFGAMVNPMPEAVYQAFWDTATWGVAARRRIFEGWLSLVIVSIDDFNFVITLNPDYLIAYNEAVEGGEVSIDAPCPCLSF